MIKFISLMSGSSGNAALISYNNTDLLIDCGGSGKFIENALLKAGTSIHEISAILITHEHSDHVKGVGVLSRRYGVPIYATEKTHSSITKAGDINPELKINIHNSTSFYIGDIEITPVPIHHDAADPVGYLFNSGLEKCAILTDTGHISDDQLNTLRGCKSIILESNHDTEMLRCGPYPFYLKQRILSDYGHLSNDAAAEASLKLIRGGTEHIALGHLSAHNNLPEIALLSSDQYLRKAGVNIGKDVTLQIAQRHDITKIET